MGVNCSLFQMDVLQELRRVAHEHVHPLLVRSATDTRQAWNCTGKLDQIQQLLKPPREHNPFGTGHHPGLLALLYGQRFAETCIRIPNDIHTRGGWDRGAARRAIRLELPHEIVHRRPKGGFEDHAASALEHNWKFARELVLDCAPLSDMLNRKVFEAAGPSRRVTTKVATSNVEMFDWIFAGAWAASVESLTRARPSGE